MKTRSLGAEGPEVSVVGLGTNNFGPRIDYEQTVAVIDAAIEAGITLFDTADIYGQGTSDLVRQISVEWQPSWPWEPVGLLFWLLVLAVVAGRLLRRPGTSTAELLLATGTGFLAATSGVSDLDVQKLYTNDFNSFAKNG